ncbi:PBECR4 domain-containing protein [Floccifex sp.]|uniref:PBECR4 domain-containing protein n=1 Tax=Floccifex sp. TaxID=2815810 RepID=UPI003F057D61
MSHYKISEKEKCRLREAAILGARFYKDYLMDKKFIVITDDYQIHEIVFYKKDFLHLTGLKTNIKKSETFLDLCINGKISTGNILTNQRHNKNTLKNKSKILLKLDKFLHTDTSTNLYLYELKTSSYTFPSAIKNDKENCTIAFKDDDLHARSLRKAINSNNFLESHLILAVLEKKNSSLKTIYQRYVK